MSFQLFSQRDPRWASVILLGGPDTIGSAGCLLTTLAMINWNAYGDSHYTPATLDSLFVADRDFVAGDLLTDQALSKAWPTRYSEVRENGYDAAKVLAAVNAADEFCYLGLAKPGGTHFVLAAGANLIADPWTGKYGELTGYTHYGWSVTDMVFVTKHPLPVPPVPQPLPKPTPIPLPHWFVEDEAGVVILSPWNSLDAAKGFADQEAKDNPGHQFVVEDDSDTSVYVGFVPLPAPPIPTPPAPAPPVIHPDAWAGLAGEIQALIVKILEHFGLIRGTT